MLVQLKWAWLNQCNLVAEALASDLKPHSRQLVAVAKDILIGCDDATWQVAAPASCSIICALGVLLQSHIAR